MELQCPQCSKWMAVSREELVIHDCQVVCPQCLAVCTYENGTLIVRDDSDAPYRHTANAGAVKQDNSKFCYSCGKKLPSGISFCPYCGADLKAPFDGIQPKPQPQPAITEVITPEPVKKPEPEVVEEQQPSAQRQSSSSQVEDKLRTMPHYNTMHPRLHQHGTMPSRTFKIAAYAIIAVLLIVLVCIIVAGSSIETAV